MSQVLSKLQILLHADTANYRAQMKRATDETKKALKDTDDVQASLYMVAYSLCDEQGKRLFGDKDVDELGKMSATQMTAIVNVINHINGFDIAQDALKKN